MIFSQEDQPGTHSTPAVIAREPNIDRRLVSRVIDQDLGLLPYRKLKVQKFIDSNIENHLFHSRKLLSKFAQKTLQTAFFSDEKIFKVNKLYNSHNNVVYVRKKMRKVEVPRERLFCKTEDFTKKKMVSVAILKAGKTN